jgi:hypothetical protein
MPITLNQPIIVEVQQRLNSDLATNIAAVNAEQTDGFDVEVPGTEEIFDYIPPPGLLTAFPSVGIGDGPSRFEDDIGSSATGRHELLIVAYEQDADQRALAWKLRRHCQAIVRTILDGRNLDSAAWGTGLVAIRPGPTIEDDPDNPKVWTSWSGVHIWAKKEEE